MPQRARDLLPLKPLVFDVLLSLSDRDQHGWSLVREIQQRTGGDRILPANFYRTLRGMLADGLIEDAGRRRSTADDDPPRPHGPDRRYFRLTPLGREAAALEARRVQELAADVRMRPLLRKPVR